MAQIPKEENMPITNGLPQSYQTEVDHCFALFFYNNTWCMLLVRKLFVL